MSYWFHIIKDFRQASAFHQITLKKLKGLIRIQQLSSFFFLRHKINYSVFSFVWQDLFLMKSCWLASLMNFNWQFFIGIVQNYLLCYFQLEWKPTQAYNSMEHCFSLFASSRITRCPPILWNFPSLRSLKGIVVKLEFI